MALYRRNMMLSGTEDTVIGKTANTNCLSFTDHFQMSMPSQIVIYSNNFNSVLRKGRRV